MPTNDPNEFERSNQQRQTGIIGEFAEFLKQNKKFWLIPLLLALLVIAALLILGGTAAAPFIYTLF